MAGMKLVNVKARREQDGCDCSAVMIVAAVQLWLWLQCSDGCGCSATWGVEVKKCKGDVR